jgi:hypothetical protein
MICARWSMNREETVEGGGDLNGLPSCGGSLHGHSHELTNVEESCAVPNIPWGGPEFGCTRRLSHADLVLVHEGVGPLDQGEGVGDLGDVAQDLSFASNPRWR